MITPYRCGALPEPTLRCALLCKHFGLGILPDRKHILPPHRLLPEVSSVIDRFPPMEHAGSRLCRFKKVVED